MRSPGVTASAGLRRPSFGSFTSSSPTPATSCPRIASTPTCGARTAAMQTPFARTSAIYVTSSRSAARRPARSRPFPRSATCSDRRRVLREADDPERAEAVRIEQRFDRRSTARRAKLLDRRRRPGRRFTDAKRHQHVTLRRRPREAKPRPFGRAPDRREVDARREVVPSGVGERIRDEPVLRESPNGPRALARQEIALVTTVVDEHDVAGGERRREARSPAPLRRARLPTSANRDALGDPPAQVRRARRSQDFGQLARVLADEDLAHALARSDEHVDRKRIEHLVRENDPLDRGEVVGHGCPAEIASLEREGLLRAETRRYLDDRRTRAPRGFGALALERGEEVAHEDPPPGPGLHEIPRGRLAHELPQVGDGACQRAAECRAKIDRRDVVAIEPERRPGRVVAIILVEERRLHVVGERDRSGRADAPNDPVSDGAHLGSVAAGWRRAARVSVW